MSDVPPFDPGVGRPYGARAEVEDLLGAGQVTEEEFTAAQNDPALAGIPDVNGPVMRPDLPPTAGLSTGPGPGPEAIIQPRNPNSAQVEAQVFAKLVPALELIASRRGASGATVRQLIRRVRANLPPDYYENLIAQRSAADSNADDEV